MATILSSPFFANLVLPFLLMFVMTFAILQKSKVLGDGKRQIDALVALVIGLIVVSFGNAVGIINALLPFMAVAMVVIFVFMFLISMWFQGDEKFEVGKGLRITGLILVSIAVVIAVLVVTGAWSYLIDRLFYSEDGSGLLANGVFIVIIIAAIATVWFSKSGKE